MRYRVHSRAVATVALLVGSSAAIGTVSASHAEASLAGSNFEIDVDANLKVDDASPSIDWASVNENRATDKVNGTGDDSYAGGVKEDTACPGETTDSIPPNKSDLLSFHVYEEAATTGNKGFLNLAWSRVSDPSGTTLMDFEFNQSSTNCASGPNKVRTTGDLLIEYAIDQGGARADITARTWSGSAWGPAEDLDINNPLCGNAPCAAGTINQSPIPAADSDGLITTGQKNARTFGEAQIDLRLIFQSDRCVSFGSAMLKSRSSDAFTSQLKDFVRPVGIDLQNCGSVIIRKQTDPSGATASFGYTKTFATDPATDATFSLTDDGVQTFDNVLFGSGLTVNEDSLPSGWDFDHVDCSASTGVTPVIAGALVTFAVDDAADVLDCTYYNKSRGTLIVEKITDDGQGAFDFTSTSLTPAAFTLTTSAAGVAGKDARTFSDLAPGTYDVAETVPAGWNLVSASCSDSSDPSAIDLGAGETVTCTFHDARQVGAILISKTRKHAADGAGDHPHAGVTFTVTGGELPAAGVEYVTDANGQVCVSGLVVSGLVGDYTVTETVPAGYVADGSASQTVTVAEGDCTSAQGVAFGNTPLTDVTVSIDSDVDGGTASTIQCDNGSSASTDATGDGSLTINDLQPVVLVCTIVIDP